MNENRTTSNAPSHGNGHGETLAGVASMWPTPQAGEEHKLGGMTLETAQRRDSAGFQMTLNAAAQMHGPPVATTPPDGTGGSQRVDLNQRFVEALMGVPLNWLTPSTSVATDSYQQWQQQHSLNSHDDSTSPCRP
jgi:hypothetical protein